ncbi:MAG: transketolase [Desulfatitalea sp.]|nr:transketolase [Desulfatitalea sp.]NNJ98947.1 transketolase [Desulfatitalea sp.]
MERRKTDDSPELDQCCVNTIRTLSMDAIQQANSGHPGAPMGLAAAGYVLWTKVMKHNPQNPSWLNRDRFVLSGGHASMLLYSLLYLTGYDLTLEDLKNFRQWGSKTPGHPEYGHTPGVETTTGPLGQGIANAVGMAMAERHLAARFNQSDCAIVDHFTYAICGDGDLMEGVAAESVSLAGHLGLGRLICIYDDNEISIEGSTDIAFTEDVAKRFEAYQWHVVDVADGNDLNAIEEALHEAKKVEDRPSLIVLHTQIAYGSPNKQGKADAHGAPLGDQEVCLAKGFLGCDKDLLFYVPEEAMAYCRQTAARGELAEKQWQSTYNAYAKAYPELTEAWVNAISGFLPRDLDKDLIRFTPEQGPIATRAASGKTLNALAQRVPTLMGGSADLAPSNKTFLDGLPEFQKTCYEGRNIRFGVREHAMGAIMSGMFLHGGIRPFGGTFLVFADYVRPAIRVAALMKLPIIYVFTHDSVAVGEDGPTHQPVEHLASLRAIPNVIVLRPCDANETVDAWTMAVRTNSSPIVLALSRQKLPVLDPKQTHGQLVRGGYILADCDGRPDIILIATGAEVHLALKAQHLLAEKQIAARVVNMPSWELYERNDADYKNQVLPPDITTRLAIEAGIGMGWERYVGSAGQVIGIEHFGASAPGGTVLEKFGFTAENVAAKAEGMLQ